MRSRPRIANVAGPKRGILRKEPHSRVCVENPSPPGLRIAEFGFEGPAIGTPMDQLREIAIDAERIVVTERRYVLLSRSVANGDCSVVVNAAVGERL